MLYHNHHTLRDALHSCKEGKFAARSEHLIPLLLSKHQELQASLEAQFSFSSGEDAYGVGSFLDIKGNIPVLKWGNWTEITTPTGRTKEKNAGCGCCLVLRSYNQPFPYGDGVNLSLESCDEH